MDFDDIKAGNAVEILDPSSGVTTVLATEPVKEANGMRIIAWKTDQRVLITHRNFVRLL
jgi:hypothetical protein